MAKKLKYNYSTVRLSKVLSNIYHIEKDKVQLSNRNKNNEIIMGYLSNISEDKGIFEFIDSIGKLENRIEEKVMCQEQKTQH